MGTAHNRRGINVAAALTVGFATTVSMWAVGYVGRLPGLSTPAWLLFALLFAVMLGAGYLARVRGGLNLSTAVVAGALCGVLNLLIIGSLLGGKQHALLPAELARLAILWSTSAIAIGAACAALGWAFAALSRRPTIAAPTVTEARDERRSAWLMRFACVAVIATLLLISVGGTVTGFQAGMAVPDWPSSFGYNMFLFPLAKMTGGIYFEHSHRLFGALVGLTTLTLAILVTALERRRAVRIVAWMLVVIVIAQGLLGGIRVTNADTLLAVIHGVLAQLFFSALVALAATLSPAWEQAPPATPNAAAETDRVLIVAAILALLTQLILGAIYRHLASGLYLHLAMAGVVILLVGALALRAWGIHESLPALARPGLALLVLLGAQLALGFASLAAVMLDPSPSKPHPVQVLVTTMHQTTGAMLLACTVLLATWHARLLRPLRATAQNAGGAAPQTR